jgi:hypothetical protein
MANTKEFNQKYRRELWVQVFVKKLTEVGQEKAQDHADAAVKRFNSVFTIKGREDNGLPFAPDEEDTGERAKA